MRRAWSAKPDTAMASSSPRSTLFSNNRVEPRRSDDPAPVSRHGDARDEHEPADVPHELPLDAHIRGRQPPTKVPLDIELNGGDGGGDQQDEHSPEDEEMHEAGVSLAPDEPAVRRRVNQEGLGPPRAAACANCRRRGSARRAARSATAGRAPTPRRRGPRAPSYRRRRPSGYPMFQKSARPSSNVKLREASALCRGGARGRPRV